MKVWQAELVVDGNNQLGEGPLWHLDDQCVYWVDIIGQRIYQYSPTSRETKSYEVDQPVGVIVPTATAGQFMCGMKDGFSIFDTATGTKQRVFDPEAHLPDNRFNDGKCDAAGRFWAGTMHMEAALHAGSLYCLDPELGCRQVLTDVTISNGIAWSLDGATMYYIDTATSEVSAYAYDMTNGSISDRRTVVAIPQEEGSPDGMTIDAEGMLWIALWGGSQVIRVNPATGERLARVEVPASQVTSCAFGGEQLDELYITTAAVGLNASELAEEPLAGGLFRIKTDVRGTEVQRYGGAALHAAK